METIAENMKSTANRKQVIFERPSCVVGYCRWHCSISSDFRGKKLAFGNCLKLNVGTFIVRIQSDLAK